MLPYVMILFLAVEPPIVTPQVSPTPQVCAVYRFKNNDVRKALVAHSMKTHELIPMAVSDMDTVWRDAYSKGDLTIDVHTCRNREPQQLLRSSTPTPVPSRPEAARRARASITDLIDSRRP